MKNVSTRIRALVAGFTTPAAPSAYVELVDPLAVPHRARVVAVRNETRDTRTLILRPGAGWVGHRAGQHLTVTVPVRGRLMTRTFSISSAPERADGCFTITVKAQGAASTALVRDDLVGHCLAIGEPAGDFTLPDEPEPLAFVTAGSGITPIASMLRSLAARTALTDVVHVHFAKHEVIFGDELIALAERFPGYCLTIVTDGRRFDPAMIPERLTYACGPERLLEALPHARVERFTARLAPSVEAAGTVHFTRSQVAHRSDGKTSLLVLAENAGIRAPNGCRMGICHTCDQTLVSGAVRDLRTGDTITEPGTRIQLCVCAAAGDVALAL